MSGNGVILERLSGKKLSILVAIIFIFQLFFFLLGMLFFPNATHTETVEGVMCRDKNLYKKWTSPHKKNLKEPDEIFYLRDYIGRSISNCEKIDVDENRNVIVDASPDQIIYAFQIPLPRDNKVLRLHRLFQTMTAILQMQVLLPENNMNETNMRHKIPLHITLASRDSNDYDDDWKLIARGQVNKEFHCVKGEYSLDCDMVQLFELGSVHHHFYTINIKLGESKMFDTLKSNANFELKPKIDQPEVRLMLTFIYQTGGFTKMWLLMKSFMCPIMFLITAWFWNRILKLERKSNVLERMLLALGIAATLLNLPVEWLTLYKDLKWMILLSDLRQGLFYSTLFTFWIVFCGEHHVDNSDTNACRSFKSYWKYIGALWFGCVCLLVFELSERGMQLSDPFFSIWDSKSGSNLAVVVLVLACASALFYFALILYLVVKIFLNFRSKRSQLPAMSRMRRAFYEGVIYRFKFLLVSTVVCTAMTMAYFIVNNVNESHVYFSEAGSLNYTGGFFTGVYGMWNLYVSAVLIFYAPSHKDKLVARHYENKDADENAEFVALQTRLVQADAAYSTATESIVTAFANKISAS